jgi:uncharacterized membrane protein (DUF4010 family)
VEIFSQIPRDLTGFLLVFLFSFVIGLEQRKLHIDIEFESLFGTDRTITLIGIMGYIFYILTPERLVMFFAGGFVLSTLLGIYYFNKIRLKDQWGFTSILIALITYCLAPLIYMEPLWIVLLIIVTILIIGELKETLFNFSKKFDRNEFITLAKFIIIAGIILPLLPHTPLSKEISISPYQIWLSIVAVSSISYFSYLLKKFVFPDSGIILSGMLGGLYSSTATTIILAKKSKEGVNDAKISEGIIATTTIMYIRIWVLAYIFNQEIAFSLFPYFIVFIIAGVLIIVFLLLRNRPGNAEALKIAETHQNPLEFKTALVFGLFFAFFAVLTNLIVSRYGNVGVNVLSFIVGVTDIDPYILNLFQRSAGFLSISVIVNATIIATASNNLIKMVYAIILGGKGIRKKVMLGFSILIFVSIVSVII